MLWCCLSLILSMLNWTLRLSHQWYPVLISNSIYYVHMMVVCSWKTIENCLVKILGKFSFTSFNQLRIPFDRSNVPFRLIEQELRINQVKQIVYAEFIKILTDREFLSIDRICLFDRSNRNRELIKSSRLFIKIFSTISIDWEIHSINRKLWVLNFH